MNETDFDFSKAYKVEGWAGVAWRATGYVIEHEVVPVYDEDGEYTGFDDWEEVEDRERVKCYMVGDDAKFTFDVDELTPLDNDEYCSGCGQIGCGWC
jgi:hypothetical protein